MPDPIKDLQAGLSDDKLKQKYKLSDDDVFTLRKYNYATTKGGASVDDALELYPTVSKYVKPANNKTAVASEIETFDPKNLKVGSEQPLMPNGKAQPDITSALKKQMQDNAPGFALGETIASQPAKELIAQETGVPVNMQRTLDPIAAPEPKENKQAIKNQENADILYSTPQGRMYYDLIQPIWKTATKAGGNMAAAIVRGSGMVANPIAKALGNQEKTAAIADGLVDYFDFDRRSKENRDDAAIYATPTKLQGNLINDGKISTTKLIPKTIENLTNMAILVSGGGVGKGALFAKSYLMTEEDYRKQGKEAGLRGGQLDAFASVAAGLTSVLEGVSPNSAAVGQFKPKLVAAAVKDIKAGVSVTTAVKRAVKEYGSENAKEVGQELLQNFGDHVVKKVSDESFDSEFNENMQYKDVQKEVLETALMTILPTTLLMTPSAIRQYKPSNQTISSLDFAAGNQDVFNQAVDKSVASGEFSDTDAQTMKDNVGLYSTKVKQMREMGYSPDQSARIAFAAYKDAKSKVGTQAITDSPVLKSTIGAKAKKDEEQLQNEVKDAALGIPEVGTELSGVDLSKIVNNTPNSPASVLEEIKDKDYVVDEIDLQEKYDNDPGFKLQVEAAKESKEDPEGLRTPAIINQSGEVLDGNKRLAQQFADGETTARVFRELKEEPEATPPEPITKPLSDISEEDQSALITKRKAKTNLSDRQNKINELLQDADLYAKMPEGRLGKQKPEGVQKLNELKTRANELSLTFDPIRNTFKNESGGKVQKRFLAESNGAIIDNHVPLTERKPAVQSTFQTLYKAMPAGQSAALFFPNDISGIDGKRLNESQLNATLADVFNGVPSVQAENYLNEFEKMVENNAVLLENDGQQVSVPLSEYVQLMTEAQNEVDKAIDNGDLNIPDDVALELLKQSEKEMSDPGFQEWYFDNNFNEDGTDRQTEESNQQQAATQSGVGQNATGETSPGGEESVSEDGSDSLLQEDQTFDTPLTNKEQAKLIADKMRAFASSIEVSANAAYSRPDVIPRAMLATGIRLAAKAVEAGGAIADGIKAAVDFIKSQNTGMDDKMIRDQVVEAIVGSGVKPKRTASVKSSIKASTNTTVKDKVVTVVNELDALRKQIKAKYKTIVSEELRTSIDNILDEAEKRGVFTSTAKATAVASIARVLNKATTPAKLLKAVDKIGKIIENVEYEKNLNRANETRSKIAKAIKGKSLTRAASNVEATKAFLKIKPENVSDLAAYNEIATKVLETQKAASVKVIEGKGMVSNQTAELANIEIRRYTNQQLTFAEEQAKERTAQNYQDLVDIGVIDPNTMSLEEMQQIIEAVNDPAATPEQIQDLNESKQKEKERAFQEIINRQKDALKEMYDADTELGILEPQERELISKILSLDPETLSISQMVRMNDVINNIITNVEFYGAGELAVLAGVQADNKTMAAEIKTSGINLTKFADNLLGKMGKGFASVQLMFEFIAKSTKLASRMQQLSGIRTIFNGHSKAIVTQERTLEQYDKLKQSMGRRLDEPENRYRRGVYARIIQDLGGTLEEINAEFDRVKQLIQFSYERLNNSEDKTEIQEGKVLQKVYDEILKDSDSADAVKAKLQAIEPANIKLVDFWVNKFGERVDEVAASSEIYNNKIFERYNNYTATKAKKISGEPIASEQEDIFKVTMSSKKLDVSPSKTKLNRIKSGMLPAGTVYDFDFDSVQAERFFQTNYDLETAPAIAKVRAFFDSPVSAKLLGGEKNKKLVMENIKQAVLKQKNKQLPAPEAEQAVVKFLNILQVKGARIALGSISQLPKQYLSVASSTLANLGTDMGLYFKAFGVSNKIKLFDLSSIATRGGAKAGYNHDADVAAIERSITANNFRRNTKEVLGKVAKIAEASMSALVKSDVSVARTSWLAYYMQDLKRQGTDLSTVDWKKAHESFNEEAAAYAEQMVSRSQNPNNNTELATYYRDVKGLGSVLKNLLLPFSSFSTNQRVRMTNDVQKLFKGGEKAEAARSLAATALETGVFNAIKIYFLAGMLTTPASRALAALFGMWDDDDEKKADDYESIDIKIGDSTFNVSDKQKRLAANVMNDYFFSGLGGSVQQASQKGMNWIYSNMASEEYPNGGNPKKNPELFYVFDESKNPYAAWGMYGILPAQFESLKKNAEEAIIGQADNVIDGGMGEKVVTEKKDITSQERQAAVLNFLINSFAMFGVGDAEVTNINRKMGAIMEKKMKARYGGENILKITSKGKGEQQSSESNLP